MTKSEIRKIAKARLKDAEILLEKKRYDGSVYICGYAVELTLKHKICQKLKWTDYPVNDSYKSFKTHNLEVLLHLTGKESDIKARCLAEWSFIFNLWNPEMRYEPIGKVNRIMAENMINYTKVIIEKI